MSIEYRETTRLTDAILALGVLTPLEVLYPDFGYWYVNKCMPGIMTGNDKLIIASEHNQIVGIALGKKDDEETKLRCVRVIPQYQQRSVGVHLIEKMLYSLDEDKPACTVAEELMHAYSRVLVNFFQFRLDEVNKGMYRAGKLEYLFNKEKDELS